MNMEGPSKRMKITPDIWDYVLEFMMDHPEMATGKFMGSYGKQNLVKLWRELPDKLNGLSCGIKTATKWQKSFSDWKYNVKQKYAEIKTRRSKTGGGSVFHKSLTVQEEWLLGLVGFSFLEGDGSVHEIGLPQQVSIRPIDIEAGPATSQQSTCVEPPKNFPSETEEVIIIQCPSVSRPFSQSDISESVTTSKPRQSIRRRQGEWAVLEKFQTETMDVLHSINEHLSTMSENLGKLTNAIVQYINKI